MILFILRIFAENNDIFLRKCLDSWRNCRNFAAKILKIMRERYIWQVEGWPRVHWDASRFSELLATVNVLRGRLAGRLSMFGFEEQGETVLDSLTMEIVNSAGIEGETLNHDSVRSSVARHLGLEYGGVITPDHYTDGVVEVMIDATVNCYKPIDSERLFAWHAALFPTGRSGMYKINVGAWRNEQEAMQVISGPMGRQTVHYEAPPGSDVPEMMAEFLEWIDRCSDSIDPLIKAAVAHLWFVTIHPFDDGNGRLCRTITECLLSRADRSAQRYYSLSSEILSHRNEYYLHLERAQKGGLDITEWIVWFLETLRKAVETALDKTERVVMKKRFWDKHHDTPLNERQRKVLNKLLDGFEGKLNSSKWYKINHCSQDTATRDINDLIAKGILRKGNDGGGRSTNYELVMTDE